MTGHLIIVGWEPEPNESGWWAVKPEPDLMPVFRWVEDEDEDGDGDD